MANSVVQAIIFLVIAVLFFGGMSYIPDPYGTYIWQGASLGALTVVAMFLIGAPVTFMMNRYAYKPFVSRLIMGIIGLVAFPVILGIMFFSPKTHYFGLMPLMEGCGGNVEVTSLIDYLYAIWCTVMEPFAFYTDGPDDIRNLEDLLEKAAGYGSKLMSDKVLVSASETATYSDPQQWAEAYRVTEELTNQTSTQ